MSLPRPGCVVRSALVTFGLLFLPLAIWFAWANWRRYAGDAMALVVVSVVFLRLGLSRDDDSWISAIDDLGVPVNRK